MVGMEFFNVTVATGDHNEDSVSRVNKNKNVKKIKAVTTNNESTVKMKIIVQKITEFI